jgi:hypothetical protein
MLRNLPFAAPLFCAIAFLYGGEPASLRQEGVFWVETVHGMGALPPNGQLFISSPGNIVFRGGSGSQLTYILKRKTRAKTEQNARECLKSFAVRNGKQGNVYLLMVAPGYGSADLEISAPRTLKYVTLVTQDGIIEASDIDGSVRTKNGAGNTNIDRIGGDAEIDSAGGSTAIGSVGGIVRCVSAGGPIEATAIRGEAHFETGGGDILVRQVGGALSAFTAGGGIHVINAGSAVTAGTIGGSIEIDRAHGMVTVKNSAGGPIQVGAAAGVHCESSSGTIRLNNVFGALRASTDVGNIVAEILHGMPLLDSFLSTSAGDITVMIPSNLGVTVHAQNDGSGNVKRIVSEFPGLTVKSHGAAVVADGRLNGGGPLLRIAVSGGIIYIKRR